MTTLSATVTLREAVTFDATAGSGHTLVLDSPEVTGGGNNGFRPLEMLLVGIGGCAGMVINTMLRRARQDITAYEVKVQGVRAESHPMVFTEITVEHSIKGNDLNLDTVKQTIGVAIAKICPVVIMVDQATKTRHILRLVDATTGEEQVETLR